MEIVVEVTVSVEANVSGGVATEAVVTAMAVLVFKNCENYIFLISAIY